MDFYETSACTNLNIKEVRAPLPQWPCPVEWGVGDVLGQSQGCGGEEGAAPH